MAGSERRSRQGAEASTERELRLNLGYRRVRERRAISKDQRRNSLIATIGFFNERGGLGDLLDINFVEGDAFAIELLLEPTAVATPWG